MRSKSMTITGESTSRVADSSAEPPVTSSPSFFQRICCCCATDLKEPPVQLIRSGSLTYQQGRRAQEESTATPQSPSTNNVISAAKQSVDDDVAKPQTSQKPREADAESVNMNDLLMENVLKSTEEDRTEAVEEDNVSISTNVVQEVDENELRKALKAAGNDSNEAPKLKGRSGISKETQSASEDSEEEVEGENRKMSVIEFIRSEAHAETSATLPSPLPLSSEESNENRYLSEKMSEATQSEMSDSDEEISLEARKQLNEVGMSSKTTARAEKNSDAEERRIREFKELSSDESLKGSTEDEDEEIIMTEEDAPPPLPSSPPPRLAAQNSFSRTEQSPIPPPRTPQKSRMYANADNSDDSDAEDSDDEASGDAHPVASNGLVRMHPVNFAQHTEHDRQSVSSISSVASTATDLSEKENADEETIGVTRISVKSDGRAEIHSPKSPVRVTLEPDRNEVTDDDFSEKLI